MSLGRLAGWCAVMLCAQGCRAFHEASIKHRLTQLRFFSHEVKRPLSQIDTFLMGRRQDAVRTWCQLCLVSATTNPDGSRIYCLNAHEEQSCLVARSTPADGTRFEPAPGSQQISAQVVRSLWSALEVSSAMEAELSTEEQIDSFALEEEERFTPRWSFILGAKTGVVVSSDPPGFTVGGQAGFRYWSSLFVVPGALLEVESLVQAGRAPLGTLGAQGRIELTVWSEQNARFANLPRLSFLMSAGPLVGFGRQAALGGRAVLGLHLLHLGRFLTPLFFELGFQALEVDEQSTTGLRVALGLGF